MAKRKKRSSRPGEVSWLQRLFLILGIIILCAGVLYGFFFLSSMGPKRIDYSQVDLEVTLSEEVLALELESQELERQFDEILVLREAESADLLILQQAFELQKQFVTSVPSASKAARERLDELDARVQDFSAKPLFEQSREIELAADRLATDGEFEQAYVSYEQAHDYQKQINEMYPLSQASDAGRLARLSRRMRFTVAQPMLAVSQEHEAAAEAFERVGDWEDAEAQLTLAIAVQDRINREYRGAVQASVGRLSRLKMKLVGIRSGQDHLEIQRVSNMADDRRQAGAYLEAASLYEEAGRLQEVLNATYPDSPHASSELVADYERKSQTAKSFDLGIEIEQLHERLQTLLSLRRSREATEVIAALRRDIRQMKEAYPRSSLNDSELEVKVRYLNLVQNNIGFIQDRIYGALLPIPDVSDWKMMRCEVPQGLYSLIMGTNPSRNVGETNPVDSVSWNEAKDFCNRVSWILGKPSRLPTELEFRKALGPLRYVKLEDHVWSLELSGGSAKPVATKAAFLSGYFDLLGNVSEWLESIDRFDDEDARLIGGHAQDRIETIYKVPSSDAGRGERNRMTGFRFVVETD